MIKTNLTRIRSTTAKFGRKLLMKKDGPELKNWDSLGGCFSCAFSLHWLLVGLCTST